MDHLTRNVLTLTHLLLVLRPIASSPSASSSFVFFIFFVFFVFFFHFFSSSPSPSCFVLLNFSTSFPLPVFSSFPASSPPPRPRHLILVLLSSSERKIPIIIRRYLPDNSPTHPSYEDWSISELTIE